MAGEDKLNELQVLEQNIQNIVFQKQAFQIELNETLSALEELKISEDEVYKIIGNIFIKSSKNKILEEVENKKRILDSRINSLDKQQKILSEKSNKLREEISDLLEK